MTINALAKEMVMDRTTLGRSRHRFATRIARFAPEPSLNSHVSRIIRASSTADMDYSTRDDGNAVTSILHKVNMGDGNMATSTHKVSMPRHLQQYHGASSVVQNLQSLAALAKHRGALRRESSRHPRRRVFRSRTDLRQQAARPTRYSATCASSSYSPLMAPANHFFRARSSIAGGGREARLQTQVASMLVSSAPCLRAAH
jgi:hypothetical protein